MKITTSYTGSYFAKTGHAQTANSSLADQKQEIAKLQARDTEVKAHERAHQSVGAGLTGGATYSYTQGPDGKMYATGGEVPIQTKEGTTPKETIEIAQRIKAAALAPKDPSPQDYSVANTATMMELKARMQLLREEQKHSQAKQSYEQNSNYTIY